MAGRLARHKLLATCLGEVDTGCSEALCWAPLCLHLTACYLHAPLL